MRYADAADPVTPRMRKIWLSCFLLILGLGATFSFSAIATTMPRAEPRLLKIAKSNPQQWLSVIVQKTVKDMRVESYVTARGGHVSQELGVINGFVAEVMAKEIPGLAEAEGVRWISLDSPVGVWLIPNQDSLASTALGSGNLETMSVLHRRAADWFVVKTEQRFVPV